jgi:hypothetical protein
MIKAKVMHHVIITFYFRVIQILQLEICIEAVFLILRIKEQMTEIHACRNNRIFPVVLE